MSVTTSLTVHNLSKFYDLNPILREVTFSINSGDRVGLIGPNGSGKTTLLRLLVGEEQPDEGHVALSPSSLQLGYLPQGFEPDPAMTLSSLLHDVVGDPALLEADLARLAQALAAAPTDEAIQQQYDRTLARLSRSDNGRVPAMLSELGLADVPAEQPLAHLSGGQKTRLALALLLLDEPDLLLLDEPTNHLDIAMIEWLEKWLATFPGGALLVSHDRTFLDRTVTRVLDLDPHNQHLREYSGNYSDYLAQHERERQQQWSDYRDQVYEIRHMRQDIARTYEQARSVERSTTPRQPNVRRLAKKVARKAKSREKKLDRYLESDERVEKPIRSWQMKLEFDEAHLGRDVVQLEELSVGFPGTPPLLSAITADIQSGQRVILTGPNGSGKTTLLRTINGELDPVDGRFRLGGSVRLGYMAQEQEWLDPQQSALEAIRAAAPMNQTEARSYLHFFLFTGDDALLPARQLSYGERSRLALAVLVARGCNVLLLDEPINHLDIPSRTKFEAALQQFQGTILAVVHDRYFIERFATDVWLVDEGRITRQILRRPGH